MADVLVVDDDPDIRSLLQVALELGGHRVAAAAGGTEALADLRDRGATTLPVVILDIQMPDLDGWQVLAAIRDDDALRDAPVILCTVRASVADLGRGWIAGCDGYIPKPFDIAYVSRQVGELAATPFEELWRLRAQRRRELGAVGD